MYSQNNEEQIILELLKDTNGRLLDIGAYDGKTFSNTYQLLLNGWNGILVEPAPSVIFELIKNTQEIKHRIEIVNAAITVNKNNSLLEFNDSMGDAVSTSSKNHYDLWKNQVNYRKVFVNTITIQDILQIFGNNYEFVNIDVEGQNLEILKTIPFVEMNTKVVCVEHEYKYDAITEIMQKQGFTEYARNGENMIFRKFIKFV